MKKENTQAVIAKKKKNIRTTCYVSLVILVILLLLPVFLRKFVSDEEEEPVVKDVGVVISCNKLDESISSTFLNGLPQNLLYQIKGDYTTISTPDEIDETSVENNVNTGVISNSGAAVIEDSSTMENDVDMPIDDNNVDDSSVDENEIDPNKPKTLMDFIRSYSTISYEEAEDITSFRLVVEDLTGVDGYASKFSNIDAQLDYFASQGFSCTQTEV